ncbi:hypothetical protein STEG23_004758 [Scotinomys teguina]
MKQGTSSSFVSPSQRQKSKEQYHSTVTHLQGILMQREDVILEWIFLPCKPNKKLKTYIEKISDLIHKDFLSIYCYIPLFISNFANVILSSMVANLSDCGAVNTETMVRCLRGKDEAEILAINKVFKFIPAVVDGEFLPKHPKELLASADFHPVPSIIGVNNDEYGWLLPMILNSAQKIKEITRKTLPAVLKSTAAQMMLPPECGDLLMKEYMGDTVDPQTLQIQFTEMMGDFMFVIPALQVAHFQFDLTEEEKLLNRRMMKYWANFARHGNPNSEGLPYWPELDHDEQYLQLNIRPAVGRALKARRLQFWTKTLPQKIQELKGAQERHKEL